MEMNWSEAACRAELGVDPELFFPVAEEDTAMGARQRANAKAVCHTCPIVRECLDWALETGQEYGVWGGFSEDERAAVLLRGRHALKNLVSSATPRA